MLPLITKEGYQHNTSCVDLSFEARGQSECSANMVRHALFFRFLIFVSRMYGRVRRWFLSYNVLHAAVVLLFVVVGAQDLCDTPSAASAQNVTITGNHRGVCGYRQTGRLPIWHRRNDQLNELCCAAIVA